MKKIMYILIGLLFASLVYITFLSDIPETYIPESVTVPETEENNENMYPETGMNDRPLEGYRVDKSELEQKGLEIGKLNPMHFIKPIKKVEEVASSGKPNISVSKPVTGPATELEVTSPVEVTQPEIVTPVEPSKPDIIVEADDEEIKEVLESLDKEEIKKTFKPIEIRDFMKSFNKEKNPKDSILQVVEVTYACEKCGELFLLPIDNKNITIPKVYGENGKEDTKLPVYTGMDIVLKEGKGFTVLSKTDGVVKSIEVDKKKGCSVVVIEQENNEIIYEHLSSISDELKVDEKVKEGQIIGEVKAKGNAKGLNYNIKVDMGGYTVNSNVFVVTEEQQENSEEITENVVIDKK